MQWKNISGNLGKNAFGLWSNGQKMLTLAYKNQSDTLYLQAEDGSKRLFHYRKKGFFKNKLVLENEYGVNLGKLKKEGEQEYIEVDDKRYFLKYRNNNKEVEVIDGEAQTPVATFNLDIENPNDSSNYSLLMVACLYLKKSYTNTQAQLVL